MRVPRWVAVAVIAVFMVAGCSLPFAKRDKGPMAGSMTCLTPQVVNDKLGSKVDDVHEYPTSDDTLSCVYLAGEFAAPTVDVYLHNVTDREDFDSNRTFMTGGATVTEVPGFYDGAFTLTDPGKDTATELWVLKGNLEICITARATVEQEKALATAILDGVQ